MTTGINKDVPVKKIAGAVIGIIAYALTAALCRTFFPIYIEIPVWCVLGALCICFPIAIVKKKQGLYKISILIVYFAVLIIAIFAIITATGILQNILEAKDGKELYETLSAQYGSNLYIILIVFQFLQVTFIPIASSIVTAAGYYLCGQNIPLTILFCCIGLWAGSLFAFFLGRTFGVKLVRWVAGEKVLLKYHQFVKGKDKVMLGYMFIFPVYPDDVLCLIAGLTTMSWREFIFLQLISRPINVAATVLTLYLGTSLTKIFPLNSPLGIVFWIAVVALFVLSFIIVWKKADKLEKFMTKIISKITGRPILNDINSIYKLSVAIENADSASEEVAASETTELSSADETAAAEEPESVPTDGNADFSVSENSDQIEFIDEEAIKKAEEEREKRELEETKQAIESALKQDISIKF
ncbi:MAG: TVP38/TMEM64 family protein [Christensenellales bacterium]